MKITCRSTPRVSAPSSANMSAGAISVPPVASSLATHCLARAMLSAEASSVTFENVRVTELNSSTLKRSRGVSASSAWMTAAFACVMESPVMEPDVSITRIISRGMAVIALRSAGVACGGITITRPYSASLPFSVKSAACGAAAAVTLHVSSKSWSASSCAFVR